MSGLQKVQLQAEQAVEAGMSTDMRHQPSTDEEIESS